jgi:ABC-type glycerol-3-phosphate transport system substrate-binding protein
VEFTSRQPQTEIQLRVKSLEGEYGLLESLLLTESAAPIIKPDLIALPRHLMEQAYQEGLIIPIGDMITADTDQWFDYALEMAQVDGEISGIPFAGDLLTLAYKNDTSEDPPPNWESILSFQKALAFPASDTSALVTLAHYQSLGGEFLDGSGSYTFDDQLMLDVLEYYQLAQASGVMPYWITQFETEEQAWQSYLDRQSTLALSWSSTILSSETANTSLSGMPTQDGKAFSYATGWVWCVIPSTQENEILAVALAEFLTEELYLSIWGLQAGFMPVQTSALTSWSEMPYYATLQQLLPAAVMVPSNNLQAEYGPAVKDAVVAVLKDQIDPADAIEVLLEEIPAP